MDETFDDATGLPALSDGEADRTARHCRCSACWGFLNKYPIKRTRLWVVKCQICGNLTRGYVSSSWVERRLSESHAELQEARIALRGALPSLPQLSQTELLESLGL